MTSTKFEIKRDQYYDEFTYQDVLKMKRFVDSYLSNNRTTQPCLHDQCATCNGTGINPFGGLCVHGLSCSCPKCRIR